MATSDVHIQVLDIINEVHRRLGVNAVTALTETKLATHLLDLLNDVIIECSDYGDWQEMYREAEVTAQSSVATYVIEASAQVKRIYEIDYDNDPAPLEVRDIQDMRRLQRLASYGVPRQFAVVGVSGANPKFRPYPIPGANQDGKKFNVAFYKQPRLLTTADVSAVPAFPSRMLVQGTYAKSLLDEAGGEPTSQYQTAYLEYERMRRETHNRFNADTGTDVFFVPLNAR